MRFDVKFRLSVYLTLVLASSCLAQAEAAFLPGVLVFVLAAGLLFGLAFVLEGRWSLTIVAANVLGIVIAFGAGLWIFSRLLRPSDTFALPVPWPSLMLPYIGPVLMCLLLAKLFRPKLINDFWLLHTVGLMEVILACVLASEPLFGLLFFGYLVCALWSLSLFHGYRERLRAGASSATAAPARPRPLARAILWATVLLVLALPLFLLTPKLGESAWNPFLLSRSVPGTVGYSESMDLNRTGRLGQTEEVAFQVEAHDAGGGPKADLPPGQRWRGAVLDVYERGRWSRQTLLPLGAPRKPPARWFLATALFPRPQRGEYTVAFTVPGDSTGLFLADPVSLGDSGTVLPVASLNPTRRRSWHFQAADIVLAPNPVLQQQDYHYAQLITPGKDGGLSPVLGVNPISEEVFVQQPVAGVGHYAAELLQRMLDEGKLTRADVNIVEGAIDVPRAKWERVAQALTEHLSSSREFTYSLQLSRKNMTLDPNEDFLRNIRQGHCERFSSALTLMLRSCKIPCRIVVGFRGAEPMDEEGHFVVRQNDAHSWVEVAVSRDNRWYWRAYDPTPAEDADEAAAETAGHSWFDWRTAGALLWRDFLVDYNAEKRNEAGHGIAGWLHLPQRWQAAREALEEVGAERIAWVLVGAVAVVLLARRLRQRWRRPRAPRPVGPPTFGFAPYAELLTLLKRRLQLVPRPSQTPLEFAQQAATVLRGRAAEGSAEVPLRVVEALYRVYFGRQSAADAEAADLRRRLGELDAALGRIV